MRFNSCLVAALALSFVALGQEPKDDDDDVYEIKVVGPELQVIEADDVDVVDLVPMEGLGSIAIGKAQDADQKGGKKPRIQDDKKKSGTIEKEIDLGDGRTMKIIITGGAGESGVRTLLGKLGGGGTGGLKGSKGDFKVFRGEMPHGDFKVFRGEMPHGDFKVFQGPDALKIEPHVFNFEGFGRGGDAKESVERAMQAFERAIERAREAFARALKEGQTRDRRDDDRKDAREPRESRRTMIAGPDRDARVMIERRMKAKADKDDADEGDDKKDGDREKKVEAKRTRVAKPDIPFLGVRSPGEAKHAAEIDELRKEIKELERMVRDLKDALPKKKD